MFFIAHRQEGFQADFFGKGLTQMRKSSLAIVAMILFFLCGSASCEVELMTETEAMMPDGLHCVTIPAGMIFQMPDPKEKDLKGIFLRKPDLEMLVFAYDAQGKTVEDLTAALSEAGRTVEIREIAGERFLVYRDIDHADGTPCIGYAYLYEGWMIETSFFCGSQEAADLSTKIMESFH